MWKHYHTKYYCRKMFNEDYSDYKKIITSDYDLYTTNLDLDYTCRNWILVLLYPPYTGLNQPDNININDHKFVNSGTRRNNHMHAVARLCTRTTAAQHTTGWYTPMECSVPISIIIELPLLRLHHDQLQAIYNYS